MGAEDTSRRAALLLVGLALAGTAVFAALAAGGDLRQSLPLLWAGHGALAVSMLVAWRVVRRGGRAAWRLMLAAALVFRLVAAWGEPALSDDVYRFVWDGRVQLAGYHPYHHAPDDPALAGLRDDEVWPSINHPEVRTIYPPLAQASFLILAALGAGPLGFRMALGLADFGVVLALAWLLARLQLPGDRVVLYAWNPLAVLETAGSGHLEPLGVVLVLLACGWMASARFGSAAAALAASIQVKLLPLLLIPGFLRRTRPRSWLVLVAVSGLLVLPYAIHGPLFGPGLFVYAERWEHNAFLFTGLREGLERLDLTPLLKSWIAWLQQHLAMPPALSDFLYRHVWPPDLARVVVGVALAAWIVRLQFLRRMAVANEAYLTIAALLLVSPTVHPWYLLWVLPFAAAFLSWGWLVFALLVPLAYTAGVAGDVPWWARTIEYAPLYLWMTWSLIRRDTPWPAGDKSAPSSP